MKIKTIKRCPKCKSTNVTLWMGSQLGIIYYCKDCGYRGSIITEEDVELSDELKGKKQ